MMFSDGERWDSRQAIRGVGGGGGLAMLEVIVGLGIDRGELGGRTVSSGAVQGDEVKAVWIGKSIRRWVVCSCSYDCVVST